MAVLRIPLKSKNGKAKRPKSSTRRARRQETRQAAARNIDIELDQRARKRLMRHTTP